MRKGALWSALVASAVGAWSAWQATATYVRLTREGFEGLGECIGGGEGCHLVAASSYASIAGVPTAWIGFLFYIIIGIFIVYMLFSAEKKIMTALFSLLLSFVAIAVSAWLGFIMLTRLEILCSNCLIMDAMNLIIALALALFLGSSLKEFPTLWRKPFARLGSHMAVVLLVAAVGWIAMLQAQAKDKGEKRVSVEEKLRAHYAGSLYPIEVDQAWPVWGNPEAKVAIIEFSDFECPYCRVAAFNIRPYLAEFRDEVQFRFVHYPLDKSCNAGMTRELHRNACLAAKAAICSQKEGKFWEFHDELFRNQQQLERENILSLAKEYGLSTETFSGCLENEETEKRVASDIAHANRLYISGTPTVILNGRRVRYWGDGKFLQALVREELRRTKK